MAILKRRLMREKKSPEASPPVGEVSPLADTSVSEVAPASANPGKAANTAENPAEVPVPAFAPVVKRKTPLLRLTLVQKLLLVVVSISAALLSYSLVSSPRKPTPAKPELAAGDSSLNINDSHITDTKRSAGPVSETENIDKARVEPAEASSVEPLSLKLAEDCYAAKDYVRAYNACEQLHKNLKGDQFELIKDFLQLRMAQCLEKKGYDDKANQLFKKVAQSRSIALKVIANYHVSLLDMKAGEFIKARTRAYRAIALTSVLSPDCEWAFDLERDSTFLAAEAMTRQVLSLCDADKDLPDELLPRKEQKDRLSGLDETELQKVLNAGMEKLNAGLLAPQIRPVESISAGTSGGLNRWLVVCNGPGIEELLSRFAANASFNIKWEQTGGAGLQPQDAAGLNSSVTLYMPAATAHQAITTAAGAAGLMAQIDDNNVITITNPSQYTDLSAHSRLLCDNAMRLWRTLLLNYSDDSRIPDVHFALGVLQESRDRSGDAVTEYKLVANRFSQTALAPDALLRASRLKQTLRDFAGANRDLKQLIEQYPDNELVDRAYLDLAQNTMNTGLYDDACTLYRKAYNLGMSPDSQTKASFGAGLCYYQTGDFESSVKWLSRFIDFCKKQQSAEAATRPESTDNAKLYDAYLLLGKANLALGNLEAACDALNQTVQNAGAADEYVEAVSALAQTHIKQENFVAALAAVENVRAWPFSQEQVTRLMLLKSKTLRLMGLPDQAVIILTDKTPYLTDTRLRAEIMLELADCYIASENYELARAHLAEALSAIEPGPIAQQARISLAEVCLKLNEIEQAVSICEQLLETSADEQIRQKTSKILASAYSRQQEYDKAAMTLLTASNNK